MLNINATHWIYCRKNLLFWVLALLFLGSGANAKDQLVRNYHLNADFSNFSKSREITLLLRATLINQSDVALREIPIVLYPNRFKSELPNLNDLNYRLVYPDGFSAGEINILNATVSGERAKITPTKDAEFPSGTLSIVELQKPLSPGQTQEIRFNCILRVPEKYGAFGWYKKQITLSGGWYPYIPALNDNQFMLHDFPPLAKWSIDIFSPNLNIVLQGELYRQSSRTHHVVAQNARQISVSLRPDFEKTIIFGRTHHIEMFIPSGERPTVKTSFEEFFVRWLDYVEKQSELEGLSAAKLVAVQAPIREALVRQGEGMLFVSDRAFKLIESLKQYHTVPIVTGLFYQLFFNKVSNLENSHQYETILEMLSWYWTEKFMTDNQYLYRDARNLKAVKLFSFLPVIDQLVYSPQFAFVDTFYDTIYPYDPVRDDPLRFNHQMARGRTVYAKLQDELDAKKVSDLIDDYVKINMPFQKALSKQTNEIQLEEKFQRWLLPPKAVNFAIVSKKSTRNENGYEHEVVIKKTINPSVNVPVELGVFTKSGERYLYKWEGDGTIHKFKFSTQDRLRVVEIDPRRRLLETYLSDNRRPPKMKFILTQIIMNYDFNQNQPELLLSGQFRRTFGGYNRYGVGFFYFGDTYGGDIGFTRLFGKLIDRLRLAHGVSLTYQFNHIDADDVVVSDASLPNPVISSVSPTVNLSSLTASYFTGSQLSFNNPLEGGYASISATAGSNLLGGDENYFKFNISGSWLWPILNHPSHLLAVRGSLGYSGPSDMPTQAYSRLGGIFNMRGLPFDDDRFRGRHVLLASAEYRHFLKQDLDINLGLFRIRDIQGALFTDVGRVTDTVQEKADNLVLGGVDRRSGFSDLFDVKDFQSDVGYGIRLHVEYLGVNPSLLRFDVAKSLSESFPLRYYFGVTQSF
ncbi:MAG: BamA/TamA family outer membrane protein [Bdellovibrionales bacterium]|nr:BamA/TamA family outer membrane protein [Bdellovibrionales bacterium]